MHNCKTLLSSRNGLKKSSIILVTKKNGKTLDLVIITTLQIQRSELIF
jgi:hypothetical protein